MNHTIETHDATTEQGTKANSAAKKSLLNLTGYLTLAATIPPLVFTAAVFLGVASTGDLGVSISKVLLG